MRFACLVLSPLVAILLLAGSTAAASSPSSASAGPGKATVAGLETDAVPVPPSATPQLLSPSTSLSLTFTLSNPRSSELTQYLAEVEDPTSPTYHHFVTFAQFLQRFAPPESQALSVEEALAAAGAREISTLPDRSSVSAVLSAGEAEELLGVRFVTYGSMGGLPLYTAVGAVSVPASLSGLVDGVSGLSDSATAVFAAEGSSTLLGSHPAARSGAAFAHDNSTGENWYVGSDYTQAYGANELFPGPGSVPNATYPRSVAIATLLVSAYNATTEQNLPPWDPTVVRAYFNSTLGPGWPLPNVTGVPVDISGVLPPLPGGFGGWNDSTAYEIENSLDLEMAGSLAPGASLYNFYFGATLLTGSSVSAGDVADYFADDLAEALGYSYSPEHLAVVSCSFGLPDLEDPAWDAELTTAAAMGVTIVSASGDQGNAPDSLTGRPDGPWPVWPASDATDLFGALSVGGVSVALSGTPTTYPIGTTLNLTYDPDAGTVASASAWYDTTSGPGQYAGTEGGVSTVYPEPLWQFRSAAESAIVNATVLEGASVLGRAEPDVAMPANDTVATVSADTSGNIYLLVLEGTSIAAPVTAGILADVVAVENHGSSRGWTSLGFIDPEVYQFGSYFATHPGASSDPFSDVTSGHNYVFSAGTGWDATTGWGEVEAPQLLAAFGNSTLLDYNYTGPTPGLPSLPASTPASIPWTVIFAIFGVGVVVAVALVVLTARSTRSRVPPVVPWGAQVGQGVPSAGPGPPGSLPGATFLCPYCGALRPAEPVRCPQCGAF